MSEASTGPDPKAGMQVRPPLAGQWPAGSFNRARPEGRDAGVPHPIGGEPGKFRAVASASENDPKTGRLSLWITPQNRSTMQLRSILRAGPGVGATTQPLARLPKSHRHPTPPPQRSRPLRRRPRRYRRLARPRGRSASLGRSAAWTAGGRIGWSVAGPRSEPLAAPCPLAKSSPHSGRTAHLVA